MVVRTKACLKSTFWSLCPLVARNTDIPTKRVIVAEIKKFILPCIFPRVPQTISKICGIDPENVVDNLALNVGDSGSAHPLLMLTHVLENAEPNEKILVCSFGGGGDAILLETTKLIGKFKNEESISALLDLSLIHI